MFFRQVQIIGLTILRNVLILKVVVYLGEATAIRSGNGSFDQERKMSTTGKLIVLGTALTSLV